MASFNNLKDLQTYLQYQFAETLLDSMDILRVLSNTMSESVHDIVYKPFEPEWYIRRKDDGGLSDPRNGVISDVKLENGQVVLVFENIRSGQTHYLPIYEKPRDSLDGKYISETIEKGIDSNWYKQGQWTKPRPFMKETADRINQNPTELINALKSSLKERGFKVK